MLEGFVEHVDTRTCPSECGLLACCLHGCSYLGVDGGLRCLGIRIPVAMLYCSAGNLSVVKWLPGFLKHASYSLLNRHSRARSCTSLNFAARLSYFSNTSRLVRYSPYRA